MANYWTLDGFFRATFTRPSSMIRRSIVPVVFLHAFPLDARMWGAQVSFLERAGYEVIAPNLPGREPDNDLSRWAGRVLDLMPDTFIPVGCSMGGYLIFELWRQAAERMPAVVLADTRAGADTPEGRQGREDAILLLGEEGFDAWWTTQEPKLFHPGTPGEVVQRARAIASEQPITNLVATLQALAARADSRETVTEIGVPALVLVGEKDELTPPSESEAIAEALPEARLATIADAAHLTPLEKPDEFNEEVLLFLASVVP